MSKFSERMGITKPRIELQFNSMDGALTNCLWNSMFTFYLDELTPLSYPFLKVLWNSYLKRPVDTISGRWERDVDYLRDYYFSVPWFEVYDLIEFIANIYPDETLNKRFMENCNTVLESEKSAFRFVGKQITPITSKEEIAEIEEALGSPFKTVNAHLENALKLMSDRKSPDYRNSIKESISAVEAFCNLLAGKKVALGQCLKDVKDKIGLHGALEKAFSSLYGYTSEAEGIRHALMDEPTLSFEDAKFMLVSCSAFVNYLISKASKAGIKIS